MKHYGANAFDFTPNLSVNDVAVSPPLIDWRQKLRVRKVYAHRVVCRYKTHETFSKTNWADPNITVPTWYTIYDAAYSSALLTTAGAATGTFYDTSSSLYYGFQTHYVFDTSFLGSSSTVTYAELTVMLDEYLPRAYYLCGTGVYCNFYVSNVEYIHTRQQGNPINVATNGSGFAARLGPYPSRITSTSTPRWDGFNSYDTVPLAASAVNKVGDTRLTALTSDFLTMTADTTADRLILANAKCAWITIYYAVP